jgi:hypothetical protein
MLESKLVENYSVVLCVCESENQASIASQPTSASFKARVANVGGEGMASFGCARILEQKNWKTSKDQIHFTKTKKKYIAKCKAGWKEI